MQPAYENQVTRCDRRSLYIIKEFQVVFESDIERYFGLLKHNHEVGLQTYDIVVERLNNNMQILRHHHLLLKQMHDVYMRHAQMPQQGSLFTHVQRLPLDINQQILEHAYGKEFNSEPSYMVNPSPSFWS